MYSTSSDRSTLTMSNEICNTLDASVPVTVIVIFMNHEYTTRIRRLMLDMLNCAHIYPVVALSCNTRNTRSYTRISQKRHGQKRQRAILGVRVAILSV